MRNPPYPIIRAAMGTAKYSTALVRRRWANERRSQMLQKSLLGVPATPKVCRAHWTRPLSALAAWVGRGNIVVNAKKRTRQTVKVKLNFFNIGITYLQYLYYTE